MNLPHEAIEAALRSYEDFMRYSRTADPASIRRLTRIELNHDEWTKMRHAMMPENYRHPPAPPVYMGFSIYVVEPLPDPGWRIIGPTKDDRF